MTNFERIKAMTVEEMAGFIGSIKSEGEFEEMLLINDKWVFVSDLKQWLESGVSDDD